MSLIGKVIVGAAAFGTAVYGGYTVGMSQQQLKRAGPNTQQTAAAAAAAAAAAHLPCGQDGGCAFDRLAGVYDDIVDWEETGMLIGLMRWWLIRQAEGNVLELSAGTGRNLQHYRYKNITHLTLTDVSTSMLQEAQRKYFDELQLQYKQPDLTCRFLLTDAQQMVAAPGQMPHTELLPPVSPSRPSSSRDSSSSSQAGQSRSMWRFKQPGSSTDAGSSGSSDTGSSGSSDADNRSTTNNSSAPTPSLQADSLPAAGSTDSSGSKAGWRWSKQPHDSSQKQPPSPATTSSSTSSSSSSSNTSNTAGQMPGSTFAPHSFDTIVDTFGLCSCDDPVAVLRQAAQLLKPGGKLLLLEHGKGTWDFVNTAIDNQAEQHHQTYGCWYNRDILGIIQDAGLQVDSLSRWHFGTTSVIVASPAAAPAPQQQPAAAAQQAAQAA